MLGAPHPVFALLDHLNDNAGAYAVVVGGLILSLMAWSLTVQLQQLRTLRDWEEERRAAERQRLALEQARAAMEEAQLTERLEQEKIVHQSRESIAEATALLHQLKRQFG
jgi:predicted Holliday junction resolvase-like endonuclease